MMRTTVWICLIIGVIMVVGCGKNTSLKPAFSFDDNGNYTGFGVIPENYSKEQAVKDGCYVLEDAVVARGEEAWLRFIENAATGNDASIRIMSNYEDATYYTDLFCHDGNYRVFDSSSEELTDHPYQYMLDLIGRWPNAVRDNRLIVLTDDETLTFDDVSLSLLSSNFNNVSPYRLVTILIP